MHHAKEMITLIMRWLGRYREKPGGRRQRREADQECGGNEAEKGGRVNPRQQQRKDTRSLKHPSKLKTPPNNGMSTV